MCEWFAALGLCTAIVSEELVPFLNVEVLSTLPRPELAPITWKPCRSGTLNVVDPSPTPNLVEITANRLAYVDLDTAWPVQTNQPDGAEAPSQGCTDPIGMSVDDDPPNEDQDVPSCKRMTALALS